MAHANTIEELHFQIWKLKEELQMAKSAAKTFETPEVTEFVETLHNVEEGEIENGRALDSTQEKKSD